MNTRFPLLFMAFASLIIGMWAGLLRLGWQLPQQDFAAAHGALMISGFMGTLISLERAVALANLLKTRREMPYLVPLMAAIGAVGLITKLPFAAFFMTISSLGLVLIFAYLSYRHPTIFALIMGLGAIAWFAGNGLWLIGEPFYVVVPWWMAFLVLTIAGERLELSRLVRVTQFVQRLFVLATGIFLVGIVLTHLDFDTGMRVTGVGEIALAVWLLRYDIARRTIQQTGLTRFIAVCLIAGYFWLGVGGVMAMIYGGQTAGAKYDAMLHTVFLGFAFSMIFGHAPMIFPSIVNIPVSYRRGFYLHLALLHISLVMRVVGDMAGWQSVRQWGGLLNVAVLLLFLVNSALSIFPTTKRVMQLAYLLPVLMVLIGVVSYPESKAPEIQATHYDEVTVQAGQTAYQSYCSGCHGLDARGINGLGKNLVSSEFVHSLDDEALHEFIVTGRPVWDSANTTGVEMPPKGGNPALTDTEIDAMIAYLRSIAEG